MLSKWNIPDSIDISSIDNIKLSNVIIEILYRRGLRTNDKIEKYLNPTKPPRAIRDFPQLNKAVERILIAKERKEIIAICGDYDADGMTSTTLLIDVLTKLQIETLPIIPSRKDEGYGLNKNIINKLKQKGISLLITVDNGVSAIEALDLAHAKGINVIVTDHHKIKDKINNLYALIHPETTPRDSQYKSLAGVGIAYILAEEVATRLNKEETLKLSQDLFCIGTIADMANLNGANRYWLKKWINNISNTESMGLKGILTNSKIIQKKINSHDISFKIAPRINSIGRIDDPNFIIELLLEKDESAINDKIKYCEDINDNRKKITCAIEIEALNLIEKSKSIENFILLANSNWHNGVIGIVASKISQKYSKPTAILTSDGNGVMRGSARAPKGYNLMNILGECSNLLIKYGGHSAAAGFTVKANNLMTLQEKLSTSKELLDNKNKCQSLNPEAFINFNQIDDTLLNDIERLEPFGIGNPKPLFCTKNCLVKFIKYGYFGELILTLEQAQIQYNCILWEAKDILIKLNDCIDILFNLKIINNKRSRRASIEILSYKYYSEGETFILNDKVYKCSNNQDGSILIVNSKGKKINYNINNNKAYIDNKLINNDYIDLIILNSKILLGIK
ncbi:single-stranded-DNA-specific exonuclease RecJ [Prochlorococcus marinus]|uniref:single-stranded-DNA-specific exonuclease RecJ n=1 Tax=Prochlorococcus marinus TaxID=1219 RepID=UPI0022B49058|nr:single-stranded-DNA-specific exonuclease RecJ [Prochlorococcus marinus]